MMNDGSSNSAKDHPGSSYRPPSHSSTTRGLLAGPSGQGERDWQVCASCEVNWTDDTCACCGEPLCVPCSRAMLADVDVAQAAFDAMRERMWAERIARAERGE